MEGDVQFCTNCEKQVPSAYFLLHNAHCLKFLTICPECKEVILKKEMKDHQKNGHKQVQCSLCLQSLQKYLLEAHKAVCPKRPIECEFCKVAVCLSGLEEHEHNCGGQTVGRPSPKCKQPVVPAQLAGQEDIGRRKKVIFPESKQNTPEAKFSKHQDECHQFTEMIRSFDACLLKKWDAEQTQASAGERVVRPKEKKSQALKMPLSSSAARPQPALGRKEDQYNVLRACCHCHILLPLPVLKRHKEKCQRLASQSNWRF